MSIPGLEFQNFTSKFSVVEANHLSAGIMRRAGFNVIDLHFELQGQTSRRYPDGIHWPPIINRSLSLFLSRSDNVSKCLFSLFSPKDDDEPHLDEPDTLSALPGPLVPARQEDDQEAGGEDPLYVEVAAFNRPVLGIILARINLVLLSTVLFSIILKSKFSQSMFQSWR